MELYVFNLLYGILTGMAVIFTIKYYEKNDPDYGILKFPIKILLFTTAVSSFYIARICKNTIGEQMICLCSLAVCTWLLLTTSYMDQRCGMFSVFILYVAFLLEVALLIIALICGYINLSKYEVSIIITVLLLFFLMSIMKGCSKGDFGILSVIQCMYLIICPRYYVDAIFVTLLGTIIALGVARICRIKQIEIGKKKLQPLIMYYTIGTYISLLLYGASL